MFRLCGSEVRHYAGPRLFQFGCQLGESLTLDVPARLIDGGVAGQALAN